MKNQRIRDPVHNLIEFNCPDQLENTLWRVIQTSSFQRLRRIRQLGFSELVFPGATHTRFAHSLGVFHMARQLIKVIEKDVRAHGKTYKERQAAHALAAALLHDVGHGMFSHAFEAVGKDFNWPMAKHEDVSQKLIREGEIAEVLDHEFEKGFANNVADVIAQDIPNNLFGSVVSSQFDADRLDYMQRDRLMTGIQSSGVDPTWLLANLEVAEVKFGADETSAGTIQTLVLGPKAVQTAESYVLGLFHLYPNVYLHKTTRGIEVLFKALMHQIVYLCKQDQAELTGLPLHHPIIRFIENPNKLEYAIELDDTIFWGALPLLINGNNKEIQKLSRAIRERNILRCFDIRQKVEEKIPIESGDKRSKHQAHIQLICDKIAKKIQDQYPQQSGTTARFLVDQYSRLPYKRFQDSDTPLNQILIRLSSDRIINIGELSPSISHAQEYKLCRVYFFRDDNDAIAVIENILQATLMEEKNA